MTAQLRLKVIAIKVAAAVMPCLKIHFLLPKLMLFPQLYETQCLSAESCTSQQEEKAISVCCVGCVRPLAVVKARKCCQHNRDKHSFDLARYRNSAYTLFDLLFSNYMRFRKLHPAAFIRQLYISQLSFRNEAADKGALTSGAKGNEKQCLICEVFAQ